MKQANSELTRIINMNSLQLVNVGINLIEYEKIKIELVW